eukprot:s777_g33.t1
MHISLQRACECDPQDCCIFAIPVCGQVQATVFAFLSNVDSQRVLLTCVLFLCDQKEILLRRTERQHLSTFSVPSPPVQLFLQPVVPGQGGVWDLDLGSDLDFDSELYSSGNSSIVEPVTVSHAVEEANAHTFQE